MQTKKVIDVVHGVSIGTIIDAFITSDGRVDSFVIDQGRNIFSLNRDSELKINWSEITKIGEDVILIKRDI